MAYSKGRYEGNVEVFVNDTLKHVKIKENPNGHFNKENVKELYKFMKQVADKNGYKVKAFIPDPNKAEVPVILQKFGKPYLALLEDNKDKYTTSSKKSPIRVITPDFVRVEK